MKIRIFILLAISIFFVIFSRYRESFAQSKSIDASTITEKTPGYKEYKKMKFNFSYKEIYKDIEFKNLTVPGTITKWGVEGTANKFIRALRFKDITDAVEDRYNLPRGIIFAMMLEESNGIDLLPNGRGDGGFGLSHIQPAVAVDFSLKVYCNCPSMVCNGKDSRSCVVNGKKQNHAKKLADLLEKYKKDRKELIQYDDRLHPIKNLDAVGRMLACYMDGPRIKGLGPFRTAIRRYAGKYNYEAYWRDVKKTMNLLEDKKFMESVTVAFEKENKSLLINGKKGTFNLYIKESQKMNDNYGLQEYKKLPKYIPVNSVIVKKTYKNFM